MLSPLALATWISICTPWAEPRLLSALVVAGSGGVPFVITEASGQNFVAKSQAELTTRYRQLKPEGEVFIGLTQIPASRLIALGLHPEDAMDVCMNLEIGYHLFTIAHEQARKVEKSPWKTVSVAYSIFRTGQVVVDSPFGRKATDHLMSGANVSPAPMNSPVRHGILAEWSSAIATRQAARYSYPRLSPLLESAAIVEWARKQY